MILATVGTIGRDDGFAIFEGLGALMRIRSKTGSNSLPLRTLAGLRRRCTCSPGTRRPWMAADRNPGTWRTGERE